MCSSDAPDMTAANLAAQSSAETAKATLDWYKEKDKQNAPMQARLQEKALEVADQQLASSKTNDALAADYANYQKTTFRPLEQGIVADAAAYDTPAKRQAAADAAMADTNIAFAKTTDAKQRQLAANGIDPGSTRAMSVMAGQSADQATANAGAAYKARQGVETVGRAMKMDAASLGRNLASQQATSAQLALTAGNSAVSNTAAPINAANASTNANGAGFGTAIQGYNTAGNIYGNSAKTVADANSNGGIWGAVGNVAGQFAGSNAGSAAIAAFSDKTLKKNIETASPDQALEQVTSTPVKDFQYDPAKLAERGISQSEVNPGTSTGPMAQDVNATMGEDAAPGGEKINLVTMNGKTMLAVQALDKKVNKLAKLIEKGVTA